MNGFNQLIEQWKDAIEASQNAHEIELTSDRFYAHFEKEDVEGKLCVLDTYRVPGDTSSCFLDYDVYE